MKIGNCWKSREENRDGSDKHWNSWKHREEHREGLTEFKYRDGLSNVEQGSVQNINEHRETASAQEYDWELRGN